MVRSGAARAGDALAALLPLALVLPAVVFFLAAAFRLMQPVQHQPAATAVVIVSVYAALPRPVLGVLLLVCPLLAFAVAAADQWRRWRHDVSWRSDVQLLAVACGRVLRRPLPVAGALALLASAAWLALVVMHAITD